MTGKDVRPRPTLRTIASHLGVSLGTVSRALSDDPLIARETREKVRATAEQLGYTPDRAARSLRTGRTGTIILVLNPHDEVLGFSTSIIRGITRALHGTSYHLLVLPDFEGQRDGLIRKIVRNRLADGVIFSRTEPQDIRVRYLTEIRFPFVSHGRTELPFVHPFVDFDNHEFARCAALSLLEAGARRPAILLSDPRFTFGGHLLEGFRVATGTAGRVLPGVTLDTEGGAFAAVIGKILRGPDPPDGLVLPGEISGLAAMAAIHDAGLRPGQDVHLAVKQTSGVFDMIRPRISSFYEDLVETGYLMAGFLLRRIEGEEPEKLRHVQSVRVERQMAPLPQNGGPALP
ncbi:LacI family transcriptional regulator [uncultured Paracoccus sp.]|uniref:LacI family transcriptional regulator n=1 Tax=uncultured Paracoccus sp. TaxID=189685 RepID=UPI002596052D|nr:LacI family transcriptional regulator [uncultured Paracoccus sp.]